MTSGSKALISANSHFTSAIIANHFLPGTREKYAVSLSFSGQPFRLRLRKDNLEFALDVMTSMCFVHSKSSLTVTPRYLASFTSSSTCPDNSYWYGMGVSFLDTLIILHLAALIKPHSPCRSPGLKQI